jgi:hypothetical protein
MIAELLTSGFNQTEQQRLQRHRKIRIVPDPGTLGKLPLFVSQHDIIRILTLLNWKISKHFSIFLSVG